jgi:hypothetical protein
LVGATGREVEDEPDYWTACAVARAWTSAERALAMPWAALDDGFHEDPRTLEAGLAAVGLYACSTTYVARHLTDGVIPRKAIARMLDGGDMTPIEALLRVELLRHDTASDAYEVVDYFNANKRRAEVERLRAAAKARAKSAARARWAKAAADKAGSQEPSATPAALEDVDF